MHFLNTFLLCFSAYVSVVYGGCYTLPVVENSDSNVTTAGPYAEGTVAQFNCHLGFSPSGNRMYTCSGSSWVGGSYQCEPIHCGHVQTPRNGYLLEQPTYTNGSFIKFGCNEGYTMNGTSVLLCRDDGEWNPREPPVCVIKDCGDFGSVVHGSTFQDNTTNTRRNKYRSIVKVTCNRGYIIDGSPEVVCDKNGNWYMEKKPTCKALECGYYPGLNSSCVKRTAVTLNRLLFMVCKEDISSKVGPSHVKCENKKWVPDPDVIFRACFCDCKVDVDDAMIVVSNLTNGYLKHDNELIWRCKNNGQKSTDQPLKCLDGEMTMPVCTQKVTPGTQKVTPGTQKVTPEKPFIAFDVKTILSIVEFAVFFTLIMAFISVYSCYKQKQKIKETRTCLNPGINEGKIEFERAKNEDKIELERVKVEDKIELERAKVNDKIELEHAKVEDKIELERAKVEDLFELECAQVEDKIELERPKVEDKIELERAMVEDKIELECAKVEDKIELERAKVEDTIELERAKVKDKI